MQIIFFILFAALTLAMGMNLRRKNVCLKEAGQREQELQMRLEREIKIHKETETMHESVWDLANTIHLYAAVSEDETSGAVKENQRCIMKMAEEIMERLSVSAGMIPEEK